MAVTKSTQNFSDAAKSLSCPLNALTAAALALPGLVLPTAQAADDEFGVQYGHYQEEKRQLYGVESAFRPITVDTLQGSGNIKVTDRTKFTFNYTQDTWSGATPVATAPLDFRGNSTINSPNGVTGATPIITGELYFDKKLNPLQTDGFGTVIGGPNRQLVQTLSGASPETRKQGSFKLGHEWDEAALDVGGGISQERDYESSFVNLGGRLDFNQKLTTLSGGLSYTSSDTKATMDHDAQPYIDTGAFDNQITRTAAGGKIIHGNRKDWGAHFGLTQVLNKNALIEAGLGYTNSNGYMENPYKVVEVAFINDNIPPPEGAAYVGQVRALLEQRPNVRNQFNGNLSYVQHIDTLDAALHFNYRYYLDDWGINAHTFESDWAQPLGYGWTVTPRIRYYSQDAADFYTPYLVSNQAFNRGRFNRNVLPTNFSSDQRLSGYGALSGGITISKQFAKGISLDTGFEYYTHQGALKLGGGGEGSYANFDYWSVNGAIKVNLEALAASGDHGSHAHHHHQHGAPAPAGVMFDHMIGKGGFMVGYRYMYSGQSGDMLLGSNSASDPAIVAGGCGPNPCWITPSNMQMHMHMLDIMYAPTDWLNLMVMPQFMDMSMDMRRLTGAPPDVTVPNNGGVHIAHHVENGDETGGISDMGVYALFKVLDAGYHHLHMGLGLSIPFGSVDIQLRRNHQEPGGLIHYGMQLGSGTLDFKPSLTYTGNYDSWSWGAQLSGTKRLEGSGETGYALGDIFQTTAWGGYGLTNWLSATVRGVYTIQGAIQGQYNQYINKLGPMDYPMNYGGRFWDVGFGLNATVPGGDLAGNTLGVEWLQPVSTDYNGYQLNRDGSLSATWHYAF
ncbi:DUF3570 domain-containing protein [Methylomicrobium sp. Wu6]|uniref:DUF3570 domain-containing protein n=1 Tax=Methylomicrobium sp. Wu6 TaxID=3107928 RepID=UPI002DD68451|nr:DUF3570 domain-containing protein [Methylomicrobium sp. Wu6]MEC4748388.1 DUF3570 domain-containing protein [Methylomicrobium sp. Wu6]